MSKLILITIIALSVVLLVSYAITRMTRVVNAKMDEKHGEEFPNSKNPEDLENRIEKVVEETNDLKKIVTSKKEEIESLHNKLNNQ